LELDVAQRARGDHLRQIHDMYRAELEFLLRVTQQVEDGVAQIADIRQALHDLALRRQLETYGSMCGRFCQLLDTHHRIEDAHIFPQARALDDGHYAPVVDQLRREHELVHAMLLAIDDAVTAVMDGSGPLGDVLDQIRELGDLLISHFRYEETELAEPLGLLDMPI
jgi:hypothetical protein